MKKYFLSTILSFAIAYTANAQHEFLGYKTASEALKAQSSAMLALSPAEQRASGTLSDVDLHANATLNSNPAYMQIHCHSPTECSWICRCVGG